MYSEVNVGKSVGEQMAVGIRMLISPRLELNQSKIGEKDSLYKE